MFDSKLVYDKSQPVLFEAVRAYHIDRMFDID